MSSLFIGVYIATYAYEAQTDEELAITPGDLLYLLEKSDVDDWWKVKKRVVSAGDQEVEEPVGLVPSYYIEPAPVVARATALYDYTKQTEEELTFGEGDAFDVYDESDPDWLLVGQGEAYGFLPSNYVELAASGAANGAAAVIAPQPVPALANNGAGFAPPPVHPTRHETVEPLDVEPEEDLPPTPQRREQVEDVEDDAPPRPTRPTAEHRPSVSSHQSQASEEPQHTFDGEFFKWFIDEIDGRKKKAVILGIGQGLITLKPNTGKSKFLRSQSSIDEEWRIKDLKSFSSEKKHLFLELVHPTASVELHCGSRDVADAVVSILGDLKGAENQRGLKEVAIASQPSSNASNKKIGRLLYNFEAQGSDELECREGDEVYILDQAKSQDWWMCENIDTRKQGVIPSSYIEIVGSSNLDKLTDAPTRQKSTKSSKGRVVKGDEKSKKRAHRDREERDKIREKDRMEREKARSSSKSDPDDKSMPNFHRVRTWIDSSGSFKVEAEFLGCIEGKIHLHKTNGVKIAVGATKLSIEDLEYVEKVTGTSLENYKEEVARNNAKRKAAADKKARKEHRSENELPPLPAQKTATAAINDVPPPQPSRPRANGAAQQKDPDYDWFDFFLECGVDIGNCQRYTLNFNREQMDENILSDITPSLLRTLGLREGDIIRVMKHLDTKFDRKKPDTAADASTGGGLFTGPNGALKNNSTSEISKVDAAALPTPTKPLPQVQATPATPAKFEDDSWAVKPAARSNEDLLKPAAPQQPQYTGSLQDLVNIKPLETGPSPVKTPENKVSGGYAPSAPAMTPVKTGNLIQPGQQFEAKTGTIVSPQKTGTLIPVQRTGGLVPIQATGGFISAQPTGFLPITAQPTGFLPIQATGIQPQLTFGLVPLQTGAATFQVQKTGPQMPATSFGQPTLQTGTVTMPQTTFGLPGQVTGGAPVATSFGQMSMQRTGPLVPTQRTGGSNFVTAPNTFNTQVTGGFQPQPQLQQTGANVFQQQTGGFQQPTFNQQQTGGNMFQQPTFNQQPTFQQPTFNQQPTFGQQPFNQTFNQQPTASFGQQPGFGQPPTSFGQQPQQTFGQQPSFGQQQPSFGQQQPSFGQQPTSFGQPQNSFGQPSFGQPQSFGQPPNSFGQNQNFSPQTSFGQNANGVNQVTNMFQNTSLGGQAPATSFGQSQFEGFNQPLQSQPTGSGFGNAPMQNQPTGYKANLASATPDNPFGF